MKHFSVVPLTTVVLCEKKHHRKLFSLIHNHFSDFSFPPGAHLHLLDISTYQTTVFSDNLNRSFSIFPDSNLSLFRYIRSINPSFLFNISKLPVRSLFPLLMGPPQSFCNFSFICGGIFHSYRSVTSDDNELFSILNNLIPPAADKEDIQFLKSGKGNSSQEISVEKTGMFREEEPYKTPDILWIPPRKGKRKIWDHFVKMTDIISSSDNRTMTVFFSDENSKKEFLSVFYIRGRTYELSDYGVIVSHSVDNLISGSGDGSQIVFSSSRHPMYRKIRKGGVIEKGGQLSVTTFHRFRKKDCA